MLAAFYRKITTRWQIILTQGIIIAGLAIFKGDAYQKQYFMLFILTQTTIASNPSFFITESKTYRYVMKASLENEVGSVALLALIANIPYMASLIIFYGINIETVSSMILSLGLSFFQHSHEAGVTFKLDILKWRTLFRIVYIPVVIFASEGLSPIIAATIISILGIAYGYVTIVLTHTYAD